MNKLFNLLLVLLVSSSVFADINGPEKNSSQDNSLSYTHFKRQEMKNDKISSVITEMPLDIHQKYSYMYFKVGANPFIQNIGIGKRKYIDYNHSSDKSFNLYVSAITLMDNQYMFISSYKYASLKYKNRKDSRSYKGIGYELGLFTYFNNDIAFIPIPVPNIEFIWGRESEKVKFSQLSLNVTPLIAAVWTTFAFSYVLNKPIYSLPIFAVTGTSALTYSIGF